jgi:hypothetical protein
LQTGDKFGDRWWIAFNFDDHAALIIGDITAETQALGQGVNERAKANSLHNALDSD